MSARDNGAVAKAHQKRGEVLQGLGRLDEAARHYRAALARQPDLAEAHCNLAAILIRQGAYEAALEHAARAAAARPELAEAHLNCAVAWSCRRRFVEAEAAYRRALALQPHNGQALSNLGVVLTEWPAESGAGFDRVALRRRIDALIEICTPELYAAAPATGNPAETPVLIVGMPRSGTSLVEQIAASHSRVTGAGELPDIGHIAGLLPFRGREPARQIDPDLGRRLADGYVARLQRRAGCSAAENPSGDRRWPPRSAPTAPKRC